MSEPEFARIQQACLTLGIDATARQVNQLIRYLDLLERWNKTYNLTSIRHREDMLKQHLYDCLAVVPAVQNHLFIVTQSRRRRILDVGSGGGLPGVVLAVMLPDADVVCVDAVGKKASFVRQVSLEVELPNLAAEHARIEALHAALFDLVTSRAFASLADFQRLTNSLLAPAGFWMAMKGLVPVAEIGQVPSQVDVFHVEHLVVPELNAERCLIWMKRKQPINAE